MSEITNTPTPETEKPNIETTELTDEEIEQLTGHPLPPAWLINSKKINEPMFCAAFLEDHALCCINGHRRNKRKANSRKNHHYGNPDKSGYSVLHIYTFHQIVCIILFS